MESAYERFIHELRYITKNERVSAVNTLENIKMMSLFVLSLAPVVSQSRIFLAEFPFLKKKMNPQKIYRSYLAPNQCWVAEVVKDEQR